MDSEESLAWVYGSAEKLAADALPSRAAAVFFHPAAIFVKPPKIPWRSTLFGPLPGLSSYSRRNLAVERQELSLRNHQIGQSEQRVQLCGVLFQPLVAHFLVVEEVLHDMERMLDLGPDAGFQRFQFAQQLTKPALFRDGFELAAFHGDLPVDVPVLQFFSFVGADIAGLGRFVWNGQ